MPSAMPAFQVQNYLTTPEEQAAYIEAALEEAIRPSSPPRSGTSPVRGGLRLLRPRAA